MTADEFEMKKHRFLGEGEWRIRIRDCDLVIQADVYDDAMQECIEENFDHISDTVKKKLLQRIDNAWDESAITDEERDSFLRILEEVLP